MGRVSIASPLISVTVDDGIARVAMLDQAGGNALSEEMVTVLTRSLDAVGRVRDARAVVLLGGSEVFSSGAPQELLAALARGERRPADIMLPRSLLSCPLPIVAAVEGHAVGGGFALALAADIVVLAEDRRYGFPFMNLGFTPGMGTTRLCEHVLPPAVVHELLFTGELRTGASLAGLGFNYVLPRAEVRPKAFDLAARIADQPWSAVTSLKHTLSLPRRQAFESAVTLEALMHQITLPDAIERIGDEYVV